MQELASMLEGQEGWGQKLLGVVGLMGLRIFTLTITWKRETIQAACN